MTRSILRTARVSAVLAVLLWATSAPAKITISRTDKIGIEGDSIADGHYPYQIFRMVIATMNNTWNPMTSPRALWPPPQTAPGFLNMTPVAQPGHTPTAWPPAVAAEGALPIVWNAAVSGAIASDVDGRIAAELTAHSGTTVVFLHVGRNDAAVHTSEATWIATMTSIFGKIQAAGITKVIADTPLANGEKWPSGQNADATADALLDQYATGLLALCVTYSFECADLRDNVYAVEEPIYNLPSPGTAIGPLCPGDPNGIGIHPLGPLGLGATAAEILTHITIGP
jgi:hypothetical protein